MNYEETINYLYSSVPVFQHSGASAYKPGLDRSIALDNEVGNPHRAYKTIHIAGTNGKGSVSHLLAAILQSAGYKVGLYTSPHLVDFRERIRINGEMISKDFVVGFVEKYKDFFETIQPSFFELTSTMAFDYFRQEKVDYAVIETGLGGRLDSTNIIFPMLSIITNVSMDHSQFLGETEVEIAREKAGIMKSYIPALIGESYYKEVEEVFDEVAADKETPLFYAKRMNVLKEAQLMDTGEWYIDSDDYGQLFGQLGGVAQARNNQTVLAALRLLKEQNVDIPVKAVRNGFEHVVDLTGLRGRWEVLSDSPLTIIDTGHNRAAWTYLNMHLSALMKRKKQLHMVIGVSNDKDVESMLEKMPEDAVYYFTQASIERAMPSAYLAGAALLAGLSGFVCDTVPEAIQKAQEKAGPDDVIFIGGSTFVVADAITFGEVNSE